MKPIHGILGLVPLLYGVLILVSVVVSFLRGIPLFQALAFTAIGFMFLGALLLSSKWRTAEDVYLRPNVAGTSSVALHLPSEPPVDGGKIDTPSGLRSGDHVVKAPRWRAAPIVGLAAFVAGAAMLISVFVLGFP